MPGLVTATGVLAFLADEEPELKVFALKTLNEDIDTVWFEVADALTQMYAPPRPPPDPLVVVVDLTCVFA
jgi:26S proteasome regulatory subunit N2